MGKAELRLDEIAQAMEESASDYLKLQELYEEREKLEDDPANPTLLCTRRGAGYYLSGE